MSSSTNSVITAVLPLRAGSKRVPRKNTRLIAGKPLFFWILESLHKTSSVQEVLVTTDDAEVVSLLEVHGNFEKVRIIERPAHLADDEASMLQVIAHALDFVETKAVMQLHATSPLLRPPTLADAIDTYFVSGFPDGRSLMGVTKFEGRLWSDSGDTLNHSIRELLPTQNMPLTYLDCSAFYLFSRADFNRTGNRTYGPPIFQLVDEVEAWDVDYEWQFLVAQKLLEFTKNA